MQEQFNRLGVAEYTFLIGIFLKQFYIFSSGSLQLGDVFMLLAFLCILIRKKGIVELYENKLILLFLACIIVVNYIHFFIDGSNSYVKATLYYIFNILVIMTFSDFVSNEEFCRKLCLILKACLVSQFMILLLGLGRYFSASRYEGTFNDPNQFAFYVMATFFCIYSISKNLKLGWIWPWYILSFFLIACSASTGMTLGMLLFLAILLLIEGNKAFIVIAMIMVFLFSISNYEIVFPEWLLDNPLLKRILSKLAQFGITDASESSGGIVSFLEDRGLMKIVYYPEYMLYGSGEGNFNRFELGGTNELHSTWLSLLFYYGIFPFLIFGGWCIKQIKGIRKDLIPVYLALFIESFTLINHRQPLFWMLFLLAGWSKSKKYDDEK